MVPSLIDTAENALGTVSEVALAAMRAAQAGADVLFVSLSEWWQEAGARALGEPLAWAFLGAAIFAGFAGRQALA